MGPADVREIEMERAAKRLAQLKAENSLKPKRKKRVVENPNAVEPEQNEKKQRKETNKVPESNSPPTQIDPNSEDPDEPGMDDLPEDHEKDPEADQLNEGEARGSQSSHLSFIPRLHGLLFAFGS